MANNNPNQGLRRRHSREDHPLPPNNNNDNRPETEEEEAERRRRNSRINCICYSLSSLAIVIGLAILIALKTDYYGSDSMHQRKPLFNGEKIRKAMRRTGNKIAGYFGISPAEQAKPNERGGDFQVYYHRGDAKGVVEVSADATVSDFHEAVNRVDHAAVFEEVFYGGKSVDYAHKLADLGIGSDTVVELKPMKSVFRLAHSELYLGVTTNDMDVLISSFYAAPVKKASLFGIQYPPHSSSSPLHALFLYTSTGNIYLAVEKDQLKFRDLAVYEWALSEEWSYDSEYERVEMSAEHVAAPGLFKKSLRSFLTANNLQVVLRRVFDNAFYIRMADGNYVGRVGLFLVPVQDAEFNKLFNMKKKGGVFNVFLKDDEFNYNVYLCRGENGKLVLQVSTCAGWRSILKKVKWSYRRTSAKHLEIEWVRWVGGGQLFASADGKRIDVR